MPKGERHEPWTREECAEMGKIGGKAAAVSIRQRKRLAQIADDLLARPCQGKDVLDALESAGFEVHRGKNSRHISNAVAMTANIIRIGQSMDSHAAVRAYQALAEIPISTVSAPMQIAPTPIRSRARAYAGRVTTPRPAKIDENR